MSLVVDFCRFPRSAQPLQQSGVKAILHESGCVSLWESRLGRLIGTPPSLGGAIDGRMGGAAGKAAKVQEDADAAAAVAEAVCSSLQSGSRKWSERVGGRLVEEKRGKGCQPIFPQLSTRQRLLNPVAPASSSLPCCKPVEIFPWPDLLPSPGVEFRNDPGMGDWLQRNVRIQKLLTDYVSRTSRLLPLLSCLAVLQ